MKKIVIVILTFLISISILTFGCINHLQSNSVNSKDQNILAAKTTNNAMMKNDMQTNDVYQGNILAGTLTPYIEFNKKDYDTALASNKLIILNFYATWCETCNEENPYAVAAFDAMNFSDVIGFRVNYKDSKTTPDGTALAAQFGVPYQHTKVIIKNGEMVLKSLETWDKDRYIAEVNKYR